MCLVRIRRIPFQNLDSKLSVCNNKWASKNEKINERKKNRNRHRRFVSNVAKFEFVSAIVFINFFGIRFSCTHSNCFRMCNIVVICDKSAIGVTIISRFLNKNYDNEFLRFRNVCFIIFGWNEQSIHMILCHDPQFVMPLNQHFKQQLCFYIALDFLETIDGILMI